MNTKETASTESGYAKPFPSDEPVAWYLHHAAAASDKAGVKDIRTSAREQYMREFGHRCKAARGATAIDEVALLIGVHRNTIWNIERGESLPDAFELEVMSAAYNTTPARLMSGVPSGALSAQTVDRSIHAVEADGFVYVPHFDVRVSAGNGAFNDLESVVAMRPFDASFIRYELGISHNELAMSGVAGSSMEPWLRSKDTVLTDLRDREVMTEGVHVVRVDGALLVKKLQRMPGKVLHVSSYNPQYEPFEIKSNEDMDRDFAVIGRVRWGGVTFN
ncbi:MAG: XRE family transcriptional regulator [Polaromonas sp.]